MSKDAKRLIQYTSSCTGLLLLVPVCGVGLFILALFVSGFVDALIAPGSGELMFFVVLTVAVSGAALVLLVGWAWVTQNRLVALEEDVASQWSNIEVELARRFDLIDNVVATIKQFTDTEKEVLLEFAGARGRLSQAIESGASIDDRVAIGNRLMGLWGRALVLAESYPELKSSEHFRELRSDLLETESALRSQRRAYNDSVRQYNTLIKAFPGSLVATRVGHAAHDYFATSETSYGAPSVNFA